MRSTTAATINGTGCGMEIIHEPESPGRFPVGTSAISGTFCSRETAAMASVIGVLPCAAVSWLSGCLSLNVCSLRLIAHATSK